VTKLREFLRFEEITACYYPLPTFFLLFGTPEHVEGQPYITGPKTGPWICPRAEVDMRFLAIILLCRSQFMLQPEAPTPFKTNNSFKESNNKLNFYTLSTTLMCNHEAGGGEKGQSGSKNIL